MMRGDQEQSLRHISRAAVASGHPKQLLAIMEPFIDPDNFKQLVAEIPIAQREFEAAYNQ